MSGCTQDGWFELVQGDLPAGRARDLRQHAESCLACRRRLVAATALQHEAAQLADRDDEAGRERIWRKMEADVAQLAERRRTRNAWRTLLVRPSTWLSGLGVAAALWLVLVLAWPGANTSPQPPRSGRVAQARPMEQVAQPTFPHAPMGPEPAAPAEVADAGATVQSDPDASPGQGETPPPVPERDGRSTTGRVKLACGGIVEAHGARLTYLRDLPHGADLRLERGRIDVRVPHLLAGSSLDVRTDDAVVRVIGTHFTVDKSAVGLTKVRVQEGTVWVQPAGGHRALIVLRAGQEADVPSERAYLADLLHHVDVALEAGNLDAAEQTARRYLDAAGDAADASEVRLRLAGVLRGRERWEDAIRLYHLVADGQGPKSGRENALALVASVYRDQGHAALEQATWEQYLERFPHGLHERDACLRIVELACGKRDPAAIRARMALAARFGGEALVRDVLARCAPVERP